MIRSVSILPLLGLLVSAPTALAGEAGDLGASLYTGLILPGPNHELYDPLVADHTPLSPGPALGGRFVYRPLSVLAGEVEAHLAAAGAKGASGVLLYAYRAQAHVIPPFDGLPLEPFLVAGLGNMGISSADDSLGNDLDWAVHVGPSARIPLSDKLNLRADLRYLFAAKHEVVSSPGGHTEFLIGIETIRGSTTELDIDGDGMVDSLDDCPEAAEVENGYKDDDGCPDELASLAVHVQDGDGVAVADVTVLAGGEEVGRTDRNGELALRGLMPESTVEVTARHFHMKADVDRSVSLVEGGNKALVETEWLPGRVRIVTRAGAEAISDAVASFTGPKEVEAAAVEDGDEVFFLAPGEWSIIVAANTFGIEQRDLGIGADEDSLVVIDVQLEAAKVELTREEIVILEQVLFDVGSSGVDKLSLGLLVEVANNILSSPQIKRIEVQGHTDSTGTPAGNKTLSQSRVEAVRAELIKSGVAEDILSAVGYGQEKPLAPNDTEDGRAKNRRVQFVILEQE